MARNSGKLVLLGAVTVTAVAVLIDHVMWSVNGAEIILRNGDLYMGEVSNAGLSKYKIETQAGTVFVDKSEVASTSWEIPSE